MKSIIILFFAVLISLFSFSEIHKFYISVTQIEYVKEKKSVQIVMRIFIDDLEKLLRERYDNNITLNEAKGEKQIDSYIDKYITKKVLIRINENLTDFKFLGKEYEDDIVFCYLEIENVSEISNFEISNNLFFEVFKEQQNVIKTDINAQNDSFVLTSQKNKAEVSFQ